MNKDFLEIMMINKFMILFCLLLFALTSEGAKDYNNTFTLGAGGSASDTFIFMNSSGEGRVKWNDATGRMQYTEDTGSTYIDLRDSLRGLTNGPILFGDTDGSVAQDGNNLFYDNTNNRLGLGTGSPNYQLDATGQVAFGGQKVIAGSTGLEIKTNNTLQLYNSTDTFKVSVKAPSALASDWTFTLPPSNGTNNYVLKSDGSGVSTWVDPTTVFTGFTSGQLFFGSTVGGFDQDSLLVWDDTNKRLGVGIAPATEIHTSGTVRGLQGEFGTTQEVVASTTGIELKNNTSLKLYETTGNGTSKITLKAPTALASDYSLNLPNVVGANESHLITNGSGDSSWVSGAEKNSVNGFENVSVQAVESGGAITITMKGAEGVALSSVNRGIITFRNNTITSGNTYPVRLNSDESIVIPATASLGSLGDVSNPLPYRIYIYAQYSSSTDISLFVSGSLFDEKTSITTSTIGASSDSLGVGYATAGASNVYRLIGYVDTRYDSTNGWGAITYVRTTNKSQLIEQLTPKDNILDNPEFNISQRGDFTTPALSITSATYYLDRWKTDFSLTTVNLSQITTSGPQLAETKTPTKWGRLTSGSTASGYMTFYQTLEYPERLYNKTVSISAWVKSTNANARIMIYNGSTYYGASQNNHSGSGYWELLKATFTLPSSGSIKFYVGMIGSTTGAVNVSITSGHYFEVTGAKLEVSDYPTPFIARDEAEDLRRCLRFAWTPTSAVARSVYGSLVYHLNGATKDSFWYINLPIPMRASPNVTTLPSVTLAYGTDYQLKSQISDGSFSDGSDGSVTIIAITYGDPLNAVTLRVRHATATIASTDYNFVLYNTRKLTFSADL